MTDSEISAAPDPDQEPAQAVIAAFGGIRPMAHKLGVAVSTVQGWKERRTIPRSRHAEILIAARAQKIPLDPDLLAASDQTQAPTIEGEAATLAESGPATHPPAAHPPASHPPATHPPASEPPASEPPASEPLEDPPAGSAASAEPDPGTARDPGTAAPEPQAPPASASRPEPHGEPQGGPHGGRQAGPQRQPPGWLARVSPQLPAAALGAAVLAVGFLLAVGTSGIWLERGDEAGAVDPALVAALQQRIEDLEAREAAPAALDQAALERLTQQVAAALEGSGEERLAALEETVSGLASELGSLQGRVGDLLDALAAQPQGGAGGNGGELAALRDDVTALQRIVQSLQDTLAALPRGEGTAAAGETEALGGAVAALETRLARLEESLGELQARPAGDAEAQAALERRVATLEEGLAALRQRLEAALAELAAAPEAQGGAAAALALAATDLKEAVAAGRPYADAVALLTRLVGGEPGFADALDALRPAAESGLRSAAALAEDFAALAPEIVRAAGPGEEGDWFDSLLDDVGDLVSVRPVGEVEGEGAAARVARAERRLAEGNLAAAAAEIAALQGAPAAIAAPWLEQAQARLAGLEAADRLMRLALERLASEG